LWRPVRRLPSKGTFASRPARKGEVVGHIGCKEGGLLRGVKRGDSGKKGTYRWKASGTSGAMR